QSSASSLSSGEYLPGSLQGKISSDGCLKKEQMVVSAIASTPHSQDIDLSLSPTSGSGWLLPEVFEVTIGSKERRSLLHELCAGI
ncbi:hypothetical protein, partial [Escherichia coli]|uniref:hypothetical protein n=1 Tax=Escherichia coli TaxID=562 RepID=UPI001869E4CF